MENKPTIQSTGYIRPKQVNGQCQHNIIAPYDKIYRCLDCGEVVKDHTGYQAATKSLHGSLNSNS